MRKQRLFFSLILLVWSFASLAQSEVQMKGQLSSWLHYNADNSGYLGFGARYIPQVNFALPFKNEHLFDAEISANLYVNAGFEFSKPFQSDADIKPYRAWIRYSGKQFELRAGLQKLNFGSATMLRPLMWFDEIDARDPLKFTDGVWGLLGRYYFLNNANVWAWVLYGNEDARGWELFNHQKNKIEFGGRIQWPFAKGEVGFTYHHQNLDTTQWAPLFSLPDRFRENKFGLDIKLDWVIGFWAEGVWFAKNASLGILKNQEMLTLGVDYTFGLGSGLYIMAEHLMLASDEKAFEFNQTVHFTAGSLSYPVGLFDHLSAIFYYDWSSKNVYNFLNWQKQYTKISFNLMAYWNPVNSTLPTAGGSMNLYGGKGIQLMLIYNH